MPRTYLGNLEELLGDLNDITQGLDILDARFDGICVTILCCVHDIFDLLNLASRPFIVHRPPVFEDTVEDTQQAESHD